jgi:uncharacterized protein with HEPN domain
MSKREFKPLLIDIVVALDSLVVFTKDHTFETFQQDLKTKYAVLRCLEVVGVAANRIPKELRIQYPDIEWERIIRSRNIIAHEYEKIDYEIIWRIVSIYLPPLKITLEKIIHAQ